MMDWNEIFTKKETPVRCRHNAHHVVLHHVGYHYYHSIISKGEIIEMAFQTEIGVRCIECDNRFYTGFEEIVPVR